MLTRLHACAGERHIYSLSSAVAFSALVCFHVLLLPGAPPCVWQERRAPASAATLAVGERQAAVGAAATVLPSLSHCHVVPKCNGTTWCHTDAPALTTGHGPTKHS